MKVFYILMSCALVAASLWQIRRRDTPRNYLKLIGSLALAVFAWTANIIASLSVLLILLVVLGVSLGWITISLFFYVFARRFFPRGGKIWKELTPDERMDFAVEEFFTEERIPVEKIPEWRANRLKLQEEERALVTEKERRNQEKKREEEMLEVEKVEMQVVSDGKSRKLRFSITDQQENVWHEAGLMPGEHEGRIRFEYPPDRKTEGPWDDEPVICLFDWTDTGGNSRQMETWMRADMVFRLLSTDADVEKFWWKDAPPEWQANFRQHCVLAGGRIVDDFREYFRVKIGTDTFIIRTKYLGYLVDVALSADHRRFCVRIQGMNHQVWEGDPFSADEEIAKAAKMIDLERLSPYCFEIPVERILPVTASHRHAMSQADLYDGRCLGAAQRH